VVLEEEEEEEEAYDEEEAAAAAAAAAGGGGSRLIFLVKEDVEKYFSYPDLGSFFCFCCNLPLEETD
jgi:hypothetical protein